MKFSFVVAVCALAFGAQVATAATVGQREYKRGYNDCIRGKYDQNQHGASYKKGCRVAENKLAKKGKKAAICPIGVSQADRYKYPACQ